MLLLKILFSKLFYVKWFCSKLSTGQLYFSPQFKCIQSSIITNMQLSHWLLLSLTTNPSFCEFKNPERYMYLVKFYLCLDLAHHRIFTTRYDINFVTGMHAWSNSLPVLIMELWYYGLERHLSRKHDLHKEIFPSSVNVNQLKLCHWYCILVLYTGTVYMYWYCHWYYILREILCVSGVSPLMSKIVWRTLDWDNYKFWAYIQFFNNKPAII